MNKEQQVNRTIFVVVGRLGKSLTVSKTVPFTSHPDVGYVKIFREEEGFSIPNVKYITLQKLLAKVRPAVLKNAVRFIAEPVQLTRYALKEKPLLINGVFTLPKGLNAVIASKLSGTKSVVSVIGGTVEITTRMPLQWLWKNLNLWMLRSCDAITTKGSKVTEWLVDQGIPAEKIFNLNGSLDIDKFFIDESVGRDIDILFVGNFRKLKGPDRVLHVIQNLVNGGINIKAVYLGEGDLFDQIKKEVKERKLDENITLEGYRDDTVSFFQRSKIILMPSISEGLPTSMLEAMACGCVPVVSDVGNITDAAKHEENAIIISHWNDIGTFTRSAKRLLEDESLRRRLSLNGWKTVVKKYSPDKQTEVVDEILKYLERN